MTTDPANVSTPQPNEESLDKAGKEKTGSTVTDLVSITVEDKL